MNYKSATLLILIALLPSVCEAKKIKLSLKTPKEKQASSQNKGNEESCLEVEADNQTAVILQDGCKVIFNPDSISFAGYEKEAGASVESFITVNDSPVPIAAMKIKIIYKDLKGRMLHARTVTQHCSIPAHESRKIDIPSWDKQHTYFYYLGNEPKKVATPYQVEIIPISFQLNTTL